MEICHLIPTFFFFCSANNKRQHIPPVLHAPRSQSQVDRSWGRLGTFNGRAEYETEYMNNSVTAFDTPVLAGSTSYSYFLVKLGADFLGIREMGSFPLA